MGFTMLITWGLFTKVITSYQKWPFSAALSRTCRLSCRSVLALSGISQILVTIWPPSACCSATPVSTSRTCSPARSWMTHTDTHLTYLFTPIPIMDTNVIRSSTSGLTYILTYRNRWKMLFTTDWTSIGISYPSTGNSFKGADIFVCIINFYFPYFPQIKSILIN